MKGDLFKPEKADDVFRFHDPTTGKRYVVPIQYLKPGETITNMKKSIKTTDSRDAIADAMERNTAVLERVLERLEGPRKRFTVDHTASPDAPNSYEAVLAHFRRLPVQQAKAATEFEEAARKFHRKGVVGSEQAQQPASDRVRMSDADESLSEEFERKSREARKKMLQPGKRKLL